MDFGCDNPPTFSSGTVSVQRKKCINNNNIIPVIILPGDQAGHGDVTNLNLILHQVCIIIRKFVNNSLIKTKYCFSKKWNGYWLIIVRLIFNILLGLWEKKTNNAAEFYTKNGTTKKKAHCAENGEK